MANDFASVELEGVVFGAALRQHNRRVEGTQPAGGSVRDKMDVGKLFWTAGLVRSRSRLLAREDLLLSSWKMSGHAFHLSCGFREFWIFIVRRDAVTDEKQAAVAFCLRRMRCAQDS